MKKVFEVSWDDQPEYINEATVCFCLQDGRDQRIKGLVVKEIPKPAGFDGLAGMCREMAIRIEGIEARLAKSHEQLQNRTDKHCEVHGTIEYRINEIRLLNKINSDHFNSRIQNIFKRIGNIENQISPAAKNECKPAVKPCPFCGKEPAVSLGGYYFCVTQGCPAHTNCDAHPLEIWNKRWGDQG